ncbi:MAG: hypothetical protein ABJN42_07230, partial [Roseibium sp.]|uniref:hypothetical protein n=1 Tax=Roseibium sp. TaxID=1936156 RepID=UPI00329775F8
AEAQKNKSCPPKTTAKQLKQKAGSCLSVAFGRQWDIKTETRTKQDHQNEAPGAKADGVSMTKTKSTKKQNKTRGKTEKKNTIPRHQRFERSVTLQTCPFL